VFVDIVETHVIYVRFQIAVKNI